MDLNRDFDRTAAEHAGRTALVFPTAAGGEEAWTYAMLRERVLRAAAAFRAEGVGRGGRVALLHRNAPEFVVAYLALTRLGALAVPLNFMVRSPDELRYMLSHSQARWALTQKEFLPGLQKAAEGTRLERVWTSDDPQSPFLHRINSFEPLEAAEPASPDDVVAVLYTSGTTGSPKGVMLTHANLASNADAVREIIRFTPEDCWIALLPMFHTFCWTVCVTLPLRIGAKVVLSPSPAPPEPWLAQLKRHGVSVFCSVPQIYALLANEAAGYQGYALQEGFLRSVRLFISGAAPLSPAVSGAFRSAFGHEIVEGYGLTETSPVSTLNPPGRVKAGSVGTAIPGVRVRIVDEAGLELPTGAEGEIEVQGPNVMKGYLDDEAATREAVGPGGWFKTGDIGALDPEGYVFIRDRKKDMIIVGGLKVFPAQVEKVLLAHPAVQEAAVVGIPEGAGEERIKAFLVLRQGASADVFQLHQFCRQKFDPFKRPKDIEIVPELPKNALQKTLKRVLRQREIGKRPS